MKKLSRVICVLLIAVALLLLSGCFVSSAEELYSLPKMEEQQLYLIEMVEIEIIAGCEYSAPTSGAYRQSIQFADIDADGASEAIVFFRDANAELKIVIYSETENGYVQVASVICEGTSFGSVEYADLNADGYTELIVETQAGSSLKMLKVYSLRDWVCDTLMTDNCAGFKAFDFDGDGIQELLCVSYEAQSGGQVEMHKISSNDTVSTSEAELSEGIVSLDRIRTTTLADGAEAVFVESMLDEDTLVTDIFVCDRNGTLTNITLDGQNKVSDTTRVKNAYCTDINGDRSLEVPSSVVLMQQGDDTAYYYRYDWYSYYSNGFMLRLLTTYHCYNDGWYLTIPDAWVDSFTVRRDDGSSGERRVVISLVEGGEITDLIIIYTLTGDNRYDRAELDERFVLKEESTTVYAAKLLVGVGELDEAIGSQELIDRFNIIYSEWNTGTV